ncbi:MAG: VWA domain-containing protein [Coriobacteriia bacterium]|nr:VWA domain-containing protein [Coriobacteriia bacterium]
MKRLAKRWAIALTGTLLLCALCAPSAFAAKRPPVLLVHGWSDSSERWLASGWIDGRETVKKDTEWALLKAGVSSAFYYASDEPVVYLFDYHALQDGKGDIRQNARNLGAAIEVIRKRDKCDQVFVVAHSMGGLVSRTYMQGASGRKYADDVLGLVTITSPHGGVSVLDELSLGGAGVVAPWIADWYSSDGGKQMQVSSAESIVDSLDQDAASTPVDANYAYVVGNHWPYWGDGLVKTVEAKPGPSARSKVPWVSYWADSIHSENIAGWMWDYVHPGNLSDADEDEAVCSDDGVKKFVKGRYDAAVKGGPVSTKSPSTSLVLDCSGSMIGEKIESAKTAADAALDIVEGVGKQSGVNSKVGLVRFNEAAEPIESPTVKYKKLRTSIQGLDAGGSTNLVDAIQTGMEQLAGANSPVMILLSDGVDEQGNTNDQIISAADEARDKGITIYTIGFGTPGYDIDEELLKAVAGNDDRYSYADPSSLVGLAGGFLYSQVAATSQVLGKYQGSVAQGQTDSAGSFTVGETSGTLQAVLYWPGSTLELKLKDPDGVEIADGYPGLKVVRSTSPAQVFIENAKQGDWELSVYGESTSMDQEPYYALAAFEPTTQPAPAVPTTAPAPAAVAGGTVSDGSGVLLFLGALCLAGAVAAVVARGRRGEAPEKSPERAGGVSAESTQTVLWALQSESGGQFPLSSGVNRIGRDADNDVVLNDRSVSRHHAVVIVGKRDAVLRDAASSSGTLVNGEQLDGEITLGDGDVLFLGDAMLVFRSLRG